MKTFQKINQIVSLDLVCEMNEKMNERMNE